jgi:uncharacterized protein YdgA (DUF945 family)
MNGKKVLIASAAVVVLGVVAWVGLGYRTGSKVEAAIRSLVAPPAAGAAASAWKVADLKHERGLLASSGQFYLVYADGKDSYPFLVAYSVDHKALPAGAGRFSWLLRPEGPLAQEMKNVIGTDLQITGEGTIAYGGGVGSDIKVPSVSTRSAGRNLSIAPSSGTVRYDAKRLEVQWKLDKLAMRGNGQAFEVQGTAVNFDVEHATGSQAVAKVAIAQIDTSVGALEGLDLTAESRRNADRIDTSVSQSVRRIEAAGQTLTDLRMKWELNGLHAESLEKLVRLAQQSGEAMSLTSKERQTAVEAIETLLGKGLSFGMPTLTGSGKSGAVEGSFMVSIAAAQGAETGLADRVKSSGKASIKTALLSPEQVEMATGSGFAAAQGDALTTSYEYAKGLLKVNNRALDADFIDEGLAKADAELKALLTSLKSMP